MNGEPDPLIQVDGFMPDAGLHVLRQLAAGRRVLEIGTWKGRTAINMAQVATHVWAIDHFQGDAYVGVGSNTLKEAWQNIYDHQCMDKIRLVAAKWEDVLPLIDLRAFDLVLYDGDHDYQPTFDFLAQALRRCRESTTIVLDDYGPAYPQVMRAVADVVNVTPLLGRRVRVEGALWILAD